MSPDPSTGETRIRYECVKGAEVKTKAIIVPLEREGGREGVCRFTFNSNVQHNSRIKSSLGCT